MDTMIRKRLFSGIKLLAVVLAAFLTATASARAQSGGPDSSAPANRDMNLVVEDLLAGIAAQDTRSMMAYALLQLNGVGVQEDPVSAGKLLRTAAEAGEERAMYMLSVMLEQGLGMTANAQEAGILLDKAAETGFPDALFLRAQKNAFDDPTSALRDIRLAAAQGFGPALQVIATLDLWEEDQIPSVDEVSGEIPGNLRSPSDSELDINTVIAIQALLSELGYKPGPPNGQLSPETIAAIVLFQVDENLQTDGKPSEVLRDHMIGVLRLRK